MATALKTNKAKFITPLTIDLTGEMDLLKEWLK